MGLLYNAIFQIFLHQIPARLTQLVECVTSNHEVASSNLAVSIFCVFGLLRRRHGRIESFQNRLDLGSLFLHSLVSAGSLAVYYWMGKSR